MTVVSPRRHSRRFFVAVALLAQFAPLAPAAADPIGFPHENLSDLRGVANLFHMFRRACLEQPVGPELPARLLPEGYRAVSSFYHQGFVDESRPDGTAVLSKTGSEQDDRDGGHPFVSFRMPDAGAPDGACSVSWRRAWDYAEGVDQVAQGIYAVLDAQVSYRLEAVLRSVPPDGFDPDGYRVGTVTDWVTWCWDGRFCGFTLLSRFDPDDGIEISITRTAVR